MPTQRNKEGKTLRRLTWLFVCLAGCSNSAEPSPHNPASGANVYYLNFEGGSLVAGADNPTTNTSQLLNASVTLPAYLAADPQRAVKIQAIVDEVRAALAPYDISVVVSRPTSGTYDMVVAGGTSQQAGLGTGLPAATVVDCVGALLRHITLLFDLSTGHEAARQIIGSLGVSHGISASISAGDCMCIADSDCDPLTVACVISGANTPVSANADCEAGGATTMDVDQKFRNAFGAHP
jgi:hypothetical protein